MLLYVAVSIRWISIRFDLEITIYFYRAADPIHNDIPKRYVKSRIKRYLFLNFKTEWRIFKNKTLINDVIFRFVLDNILKGSVVN